MKIEPRLPQLPSLGELLEHPRVKGLVERVNRSTIAQRAGGFLEEIRSTLVERAGRVEVPSLTHLAERLARRLLGEPTAHGPVINATGLVLGDPALAPPLAEQALQAMVQLGGEFHRRDAKQLQAVERGLCELIGCEAAFIASSFEGALTLAIAAAAEGRELAVCGASDATSPLNWPWLAMRAGAVLRTGGQSAGAAAVLRAPDAEGVELAALASAKAPDACVIDAAPFAGVLNPREHGFQSVETIAERLTAGADAVVVDGSGLLGGPACGIVCGSQELVQSAAKSSLASLLAVDALTAAGLGAILPLYQNEATPAIFQLPIWQLLSAPIANLEQRAKRLAALMAEVPGVAWTHAREDESPWRQWGVRQWTSKTWIVELRPATGDPANLAARLGQGPNPLFVRQSHDAVQLDLRTVFPRWDQQLASVITAAAQ